MSRLSDEGVVAFVTGVAGTITAAMAFVAADPTLTVASAGAVGVTGLALGVRDFLGVTPTTRHHMVVVAVAIPGIAAALLGGRWVTAAVLAILGSLHIGRAAGFKVSEDADEEGAGSG